MQFNAWNCTMLLHCISIHYISAQCTMLRLLLTLEVTNPQSFITIVIIVIAVITSFIIVINTSLIIVIIIIIIIMVVITSFIIVTLISILPFHMFLCCKRYHQSQLFLIWTSDWSLFSRHLILKPLLLLLSFLFSVRFWSISVSLQRPTRRIYRLSENFGQKQTLKTRKAENLKDIQTFYLKICFLETVNCIFC